MARQCECDALAARSGESSAASEPCAQSGANCPRPVWREPQVSASEMRQANPLIAPTLVALGIEMEMFV